MRNNSHCSRGYANNSICIVLKTHIYRYHFIMTAPRFHFMLRCSIIPPFDIESNTRKTRHSHRKLRRKRIASIVRYENLKVKSVRVKACLLNFSRLLETETSRVWVTTELHRVLLDNLHRGYDGSYWSTGIKVSEKSVWKIYQLMWLWLNVEIKWFDHQLYSLLYCCSESWLTLVKRQQTQADILGALLKNRRIIRVGEREVLFKDVVNWWDYTAAVGRVAQSV